MTEEQQKGEINESLRQTLAYVDDRLLQGDYGIELEDDDESHDPSTRFEGQVLDLNDDSLTEQDKAFALDWIEKKLGAKPEQATVASRYRSADDKTNIALFEMPIGQKGDPWFLSQWQEEGKKPSYVLAREEMYEYMLEGYTESP